MLTDWADGNFDDTPAAHPTTPTATGLTCAALETASTRVVEASSKPDVKYNSYSHSFAGMGVQFILLMGMILL